MGIGAASNAQKFFVWKNFLITLYMELLLTLFKVYIGPESVILFINDIIFNWNVASSEKIMLIKNYVN